MSLIALSLTLLLGAAGADESETAPAATSDADSTAVGDAGLADEGMSLSDFRFVVEAFAGGDAFASLSPRSVGDVVWANRALSPWGGLRVGAVRDFKSGWFAGGDLGAGFNREDSGNSLVGEIRNRGLLAGRGIGGYRLALGPVGISPYGVIETQALAGVRMLGVFNDSRTSPLVGGGLRAGGGVWLELWLISLRIDGGLGVALGGIQSFGSAALGVVF